MATVVKLRAFGVSILIFMPLLDPKGVEFNPIRCSRRPEDFMLTSEYQSQVSVLTERLCDDINQMVERAAYDYVKNWLYAIAEAPQTPQDAPQTAQEAPQKRSRRPKVPYGIKVTLKCIHGRFWLNYVVRGVVRRSWTGTRRRDLLRFARQHDFKVTDLTT